MLLFLKCLSVPFVNRKMMRAICEDPRVQVSIHSIAAERAEGAAEDLRHSLWEMQQI